MNKYTGKSVFGGIAIGKIMVYEKGEHQVKRVKVTDAEAEKNRYYEAVETAFKQLGELHDKALREVGEANAAIFEIHQMMLEDDDYKESVEHIIESQMVNAEYAIAQTGDNFSQMFAAMDDEYMRGRAADVKDITERLLGILSGNTGSGVDADEPVIMVAEDLAPSETVQMDKSKILSFVTQKGSVNSHTAILARTMGIPALIGSDIVIDESLNGKLAVVDGTNGVVYIEPDEATLSAMQEEQRKDNEKKALLQELKGKEDVTLDGKKIKLYSNIGNIKLLHDLFTDLNTHFKVIANYTFNVFNSNSVLELKKLDISKFTLSPESDKNTLLNLCNYNYLQKELIVYGKIPLLNMNYCLLRRK